MSELRTSDLLGDPLPETPAMNAPLPWRVFKVSDCEWWMARTLAEAREDYLALTGEIADEDASEISEADMDRLIFVDLEPTDPSQGTIRRTFRQELAERVTGIPSKPECFACTEY